MIENLVPYVFSMNIYYAAVNDKNVTENSILKDIKKAEQIFESEEFGFGSIKGLTRWIRALQAGNTSVTYLDLQSYWGLKDSEMQQIIGPSSFIKALYSATEVSYALEYNCKKFCDNTTMFGIQWASQNITKLNSTFVSPNVKPVESLYDLDNSLFGARPEFSYAISQLELSTEDLNYTQALNLASIESFDDQASIINPRNLYDYFVSYQAERYDNLLIKFKLTSEQQADAIYKYMINYVVPKLANYEDKGGTKQHKSFARLMTYTFNKTEEYLKEFLPGALHTRYVAAGLIKDKKTCSPYISIGVKNSSQVEEICKNYNFSTYEGSHPWTFAYIGGQGSEAYNLLQEATNTTDQELGDILSSTTRGAFGRYCSDVFKDVSNFYKCSSNPCSSEELAYRQFKSSEITRSIKSQYIDQGVLFETDTVANWGYSRGVPLEYGYFSENFCNDTLEITDESYNLIVNGPNSLANFSDAINFVIDLDHNQNVDNYTDMYKISAKSLFCTLRHMTENSLLGGMLIPMNEEKVIFGYDEPLLDFLKEGNFTKGSDPSVQTHVSINNIYYNKTLMNDTNTEIYTGNRHPEKVKKARSINGGVYINNVVSFYDGYNVTHGNINPLKINEKVEGTDGVQFNPFIKKSDQLAIFDQNKMFDVEYKFDDKKSYDKIDAYKFKFDTKTTKANDKNMDKNIYYDGFFNISSSFKMPISVSNAYFKDCKEEDYGKVKIDGEEPSAKQGEVRNFFTVEPKSGLMIETYKDELISLNVHENYLTFPSLDGLSGFIPIMQVQSETKVNQDVFNDKYAFVNTFQDIKFYFRVIFYPLAGFF